MGNITPKGKATSPISSAEIETTTPEVVPDDVDDHSLECYLPEDIIINEILTRLPTISHIARLRCVCKSWHRALSDPTTITTILFSHPTGAKEEEEEANAAQILVKGCINPLLKGKQQRPVFSLLSYNTLKPIPTSPPRRLQDFPTLPGTTDCNPRSLSIVGCCDGIVCIENCTGANTLDMVLWNPATSETKKVPRTPSFRRNHDRPRPDHHWWSDFAFEQTGFGFDSKTNDYKVVRIAYEASNSMGRPIPEIGHSVEVYSLRNDSWRLLLRGGDETASQNIPYSKRVILPHGSRCQTIYWWNWDDHRYDHEKPPTSVIFSFDLARQTFDSASFRNPGGKERWAGHSVSMVKGCIVGVFSDSTVELVERRLDGSMEIWALLDLNTGATWTRLFSVPKLIPGFIPANIPGLPKLRNNYSVPAIWKHGRLFVEAFRADKRRGLFVYSSDGEGGGEGGRLDVVDGIDEEMDAYRFEVVAFVPSRISLSGLKSNGWFSFF